MTFTEAAALAEAGYLPLSAYLLGDWNPDGSSAPAEAISPVPVSRTFSSDGGLARGKGEGSALSIAYKGYAAGIQSRPSVHLYQSNQRFSPRWHLSRDC